MSNSLIRVQPGSLQRADRTLNLRADFGAVADAVCLVDAALSSGSNVLTSATAGFTSADQGKLVYVRCNTTILKTTISTVTNSTTVVLAASAPGNISNDGGPNVNAIYGTDNAAAFASAFTAAQASVIPATDNQSRWRKRYKVYAPAGNYLISTGVAPFTVSGLAIEGDGSAATKFIFMDDANALFQMDTYSATPSSAYVGIAYDFRVKSLSIINPLRMSAPAFEGSRVGAAIQDNGSGGADLTDVTIKGYKYGFYGAYGSDFSKFTENCQFSYCDVGAYFGPGSQQLTFDSTDWFACREGVVLEGAPHWYMNGCSFEDPLVAAITIEAKPTGNTRSGVSVSLSGATYSGSMTVIGTWFESNAGGSSRLAPRMIYINGDAPGINPCGGVMARDCYLVSGGAQVSGGHNVFLEMNSTNYVVNYVDNLYIRGNYINGVVKYSGAASTCNFKITNTALPSGSNITYQSGSTGGGSNIYDNGNGSTVGTFSMQQIIAANPALTLMQVAAGGASNQPIFKVRSDSSSTPISGIAYGGAFFGAFTTQAISGTGNTVTIDSSRTNAHKLTLGGTITTMSIINPTNGQQLTISLAQDATGGRTYVWPSSCKFAGASAPSDTTANRTTSVTFVYDGTNWNEISRAVAVG